MAGESEVLRRQAGFILLEAVVALTILSVASIAALRAVDGDLNGAVRARRTLASTALVEDRLEAIRLLGGSGFASPPDSVMHGQFAAPFGAYAWRTEIEPVYGFSGLWRVSIDVTWDGGDRPLATLLYRPTAGGGS